MKIGANLRNNTKLAPMDVLSSTVDAAALYYAEREKTNKIRLNIAVNTIASNVLFNPSTEIVMEEGSVSAVSLNYSTDEEIRQHISLENKAVKDFRDNHIVDNTILSNDDFNCKYHCGLDFFNTHILRNDSFKLVNYENSNSESEYFNTISDYQRNHKGDIVSDEIFSDTSRIIENKHLYTMDDILSFDDCVKNKLSEDNGWLGFYNSSTVKLYDDKNKKFMDINKPLNDRNACEFVDMYPSRDLFSFVPKYNSYRHRAEYNWDYCLTYPSSSVTDGIPFITNGCLRLFLVDDYTPKRTLCRCMCHHGLKVDDTVNLYSGDTLIVPNISVVDVKNDYDFIVNLESYTIDSEWSETKENISTTTYGVERNNTIFYNVNADMMTFSFKKVEQGIECEYYVRVFSKLPNWKFASGDVTERLIYEENPSFLEEYQNQPFASQVSKLGFSKNIYNDDNAEILFTDDIDISYLHDNRGKPLSSIYLTLTKTHKGNEEWYNGNCSAETVEYSHCFTDVICGFKLNPSLHDNVYDVVSGEQTSFSNITLVNTVSGSSCSGLNVNYINSRNGYSDILQESDIHFYGDLCVYSYLNSLEESLQSCCHRFNTYQREKKVNHIVYNELQSDDYDDQGFNVIRHTLNFGRILEGYYYKPHYEMPIKTISSDLEVQQGKVSTIKRIDNRTLYTNENSYFEKGDKFIVTDLINHVYQLCEVTKVNSLREVLYSKIGADEHIIDGITRDNKLNYRIVKKDSTIPEYADFINDGSCAYRWRYVLQNGFDYDKLKDVDEYPFANGVLHISKNINLFVQRQSTDLNRLSNALFLKYSKQPIMTSEKIANNFYSENKITC